MFDLEILTPLSLPVAEACVLLKKKQELGFVPNIYGVIAASSPALKAFDELNLHFAQASFSDTEKQVIELVVSIENTCGYCVAGHSLFAKMLAVPDDIIQDLRNHRPLTDRRLGVLAEATKEIVRRKGEISDSTLKGFYEVGYSGVHLLELILGIALKMFSNFVAKSTQLDLDDAFKDHAWPPS
ncbi:carboxymuconolactone decarboxylase family protein [Temperatibacter marinus]|uniref:Carboxymuconolactone decarboxylase family protein n=1 Tax=Temperatibacter marinus TaxID=1456591 RepID=A0AA52EFX5_9PROT|nr:carboxymuconolactone decarboxylase family protein [Temperatibacter marinus]WND01797.1 carboxymuconolactone decarboxylase family protein [Temperatibacter marinus]